MLLQRVITLIVTLTCLVATFSCEQIKADMKYRKAIMKELNKDKQSNSPQDNRSSGSQSVKQKENQVKTNIKKRTRPVYNSVILGRQENSVNLKPSKEIVMIDSSAVATDSGLYNINDKTMLVKQDVKDSGLVPFPTKDMSGKTITSMDKASPQEIKELEKISLPETKDDYEIKPKNINEEKSNPQPSIVEKKEEQAIIAPVEIQSVNTKAQPVFEGDVIIGGNKKSSVKAEKQVKPVKQPVKEKDSSAVYSLQVGSFESKEEADILTEKIKAIVKKTYQQEASVNDKMFYRVKVGPFSSMKQANDAMLRIVRSGYYDVYIVEN
jgi:cell division protein FtsN